MKNILLTTLFILSTISTSSAQSYVQEGKTWNAVEGYFAIEIFETVYSNIGHFIGGDTLLGGVPYKRAYQITYFGDTLPAHSYWRSGFMCLRETADQKVYLRYSNEEQEFLAYDFGVEIGDELSVFNIRNCERRVVIDDIYPVELSNGDTVNAYQVLIADRSHPIYETWIEGIGNTLGFLKTGMIMPCTADASYDLLCCSRNDTLLYQNPKYDSCYYEQVITHTKELTSKQEYLLSPNPISTHLTIKAEKGSARIQSTQLYSIDGTLLGQYIDFIPMSDYPDGIYLVKILAENGRKQIAKVIKQ